MGLYSLEKEHKIAKIDLGLSHRPCFDDSFPGPERELGIMHSVYNVIKVTITEYKRGLKGKAKQVLLIPDEGPFLENLESYCIV